MTLVILFLRAKSMITWDVACMEPLEESDIGTGAEFLRQLKERATAFALFRRHGRELRRFHVDRHPLRIQLICQAARGTDEVFTQRTGTDANQ